MSQTLQWLVGIAAGLTAAGVIWTKGVRPAWRGTRRFVKGVAVIADAAPILIEQAQDFRPNGGGSLGEVMAAMRADDKELHDKVTAHIEADSEAFARIEAAQVLALDTGLKVAVALEVETEETAAVLKAEATPDVPPAATDAGLG